MGVIDISFPDVLANHRHEFCLGLYASNAKRRRVRYVLKFLKTTRNHQASNQECAAQYQCYARSKSCRRRAILK